MIEKTPNTPAQPPLPPGYPYGYPYPYSSIDDDEIDLREIWRILVDNKKLIAVITGGATAIAIAIALFMTPIYRAEALLAPASNEKSAAFSGLAGQFGDLAALAGINVGGGDQTQEAIATLKSRLVAEAFIKENDLMSILFERDWVANKRAWKNPDKIPTLWQAYELFDENVRSVSVDKKSGLVTLAIEWKDPILAASWANHLVEHVNRQRQREAIKEAESSISYLQKQLTKTSSVEIEQAIFRLVEAQTKNIMVAQARAEYAFKVIDPAVPPEKQAKPKRGLILVLGISTGLMLGVFVALIRNAMVRKK